MDWSGPFGQVDEPARAPRRAAVVPRARAASGSAALPLERHVRAMLDAGARGVVQLIGPPGSGKTTALEHLAAALPADAPVSLVDRGTDPPDERLFSQRDQLVLYPCWTGEPSRGVLATLSIAPWTDDDLIEYLAATHRGRCRSVMERVHRSSGREELQGLPELWHIVLDVLAADESMPDVKSALMWRLAMELPTQADRMEAGKFCTRRLVGVPMPVSSFNARVDRLLRHASVQLPLASESLITELCSGSGEEYFTRWLPIELIRRVALSVRQNASARAALQAMAEGNRREVHSSAISVLCAMQSDWRPRDASELSLTGARIARVDWAGVYLPKVEITSADLSGADLTDAVLPEAIACGTDLPEATLRGAWLDGGHFRLANLRRADLSKTHALRCDFSNASLNGAELCGADLREAKLARTDLRGARLNRANLRRATIERCDVDGASLRGADLRGATLNRLRLRDVDCARANCRRANLVDCNLEEMELPGANFRKAAFRDCLLSDSFMPGADFRGAILRGAGLAGVDWPGADLRNADLAGATFHLGSSRSGLVGSTAPCEGSKTGFYTDEYNEQDYKSPEEIRKANLCGADLRGAKIDSVDFYLVDLRGARYTRSQAAHLTRCGAILKGN